MSAIKLAASKVVKELDDLSGSDKLKLMVLSDYDIAYAMEEIEIPPKDGHAGMIETSRVMAIRPDLVKGTAEPCHPEFPPYRVEKDSEKYFPDGVMGDPQLASKEFGEKANLIIIDKLAELIMAMVNEQE